MKLRALPLPPYNRSATMIYENQDLRKLDKELREKELEEYRNNPEKKMVMMLPVRELGATIIWPKKFR